MKAACRVSQMVAVTRIRFVSGEMGTRLCRGAQWSTKMGVINHNVLATRRRPVQRKLVKVGR